MVGAAVVAEVVAHSEYNVRMTGEGHWNWASQTAGLDIE